MNYWCGVCAKWKIKNKKGQRSSILEKACTRWKEWVPFNSKLKFYRWCRSGMMGKGKGKRDAKNPPIFEISNFKVEGIIAVSCLAPCCLRCELGLLPQHTTFPFGSTKSRSMDMSTLGWYPPPPIFSYFLGYSCNICQPPPFICLHAHWCLGTLQTSIFWFIFCPLWQIIFAMPLHFQSISNNFFRESIGIGWMGYECTWSSKTFFFLFSPSLERLVCLVIKYANWRLS